MNKKSKILIINTEFFRGGAAKVARTLYYELNRKNQIDCYFAYGRGKQVKDKRVTKFTCWPEVYLHGLLNRGFGLQGYGSFFSTIKLERFISEQKFNLIHLHNLHGYYINLSFFQFLKKIKIPVIWTLHDMWSITGRCAYPFSCKKLIAGCGNCEDLKTYPRAYVDMTNFMWKRKKKIFSTEWNPVIVSPSEWLADKVKESYLQDFPIKIIPNGIDTNIFQPKNKKILREKYGISDDKKIILYVAADLKDKRKGLVYFLESLKYIDTRDYIVLTLGKKIKGNSRLLNVDVEMKQLGYFKNVNEISEIYNIADIYCITSLDENFPTTVLEAMACGIPIVGFRVGGIPEQVTDECGIMIEPKDTRALGKALKGLLHNDELLSEFGKNCRKRVLENYTIDNFVNSYMKIYNEVLRG